MRFLAILIAVVMAIVLASAQDPCMRPCGRNFDFRCGQLPDGTKQTFANPCVMEIQACQRGVDIVELHRGTCDQPLAY
ncbi:uncharacterized protein [Musca autumnalis]|uniref:uncharacterized protein n=1 Tax=Musca autumnalis TaxID=221902 RepID=UPI003CF71A1B